MIQEAKNKSMLHRFLLFENAEVTKRIGLPHGKQDIMLAHPQNKQINGFTIFFSILSLSHSFLQTSGSNWIGDKISQVIEINNYMITFTLVIKL